jgi:hypothetical protein
MLKQTSELSNNEFANSGRVTVQLLAVKFSELVTRGKNHNNRTLASGKRYKTVVWVPGVNFQG